MSGTENPTNQKFKYQITDAQYLALEKNLCEFGGILLDIVKELRLDKV